MPRSHTVSSVLGLVTALLVGLAIGVLEGYLAAATLGGLTASGLGFLAGLAFVAALCAYAIEESDTRRKSE